MYYCIINQFEIFIYAEKCVNVFHPKLHQEIFSRFFEALNSYSSGVTKILRYSIKKSGGKLSLPVKPERNFLLVSTVKKVSALFEKKQKMKICISGIMKHKSLLPDFHLI